MGCNMSEPSVDEDESLSGAAPASGTSPRPGLHNRVHDDNRRSGTLHDGSRLVAKDKDRFSDSPQKRGKGPALLNKLGDGVESVGSPSFRCYVGNGMQTDGKDIVASICEQKKAHRSFSNSPLRHETASLLHSNQEAELKSHKKEKAWMAKVLSK